MGRLELPFEETLATGSHNWRVETIGDGPVMIDGCCLATVTRESTGGENVMVVIELLKCGRLVRLEWSVQR